MRERTHGFFACAFGVRLLGLAALSFSATACSVSMIGFDPAAQVKAATPTNLRTSLSAATGITLSWNAVKDAVSYTVSRTTTSGSGYEPLSTCTAVTGTSCLDSTALPSVAYYYQVVANAPVQVSPPSAEANALYTNYVVSPSGSDTNPGTRTAPFLTVQKAVSVAQAHETIALRAGTYRESVNIITDSISLTSFMGDATPVISGAVPVNSWTAYSGNIYSATLTSVPNQLFVDGQFVPMARYPASGYATIDVGGATTTGVESSGITGLSNVVGARVHLRTQNFAIEDRTVTYYGGDEIHFSPATNYTPATGYGFYLENKLWMLTQANRWVYDSTAHKVYVWLPDGTNPGTHTMEASIYQTLQITATDVRISSIAFDKSSDEAILVNSGSSNCVFSYTKISNAGSIGLSMNGSVNSQVLNNTITNTVSDGILASYTTNSSIIGNTLTNVGTVGSPRNSTAAIDAGDTSDALIVRDNYIENAGYNGINFYYNAVVQHNIVKNPCQVLADCGGIYSYQVKTNQMSDDTIDDPYNSLVDGNTVSGAFGNFDGTPNSVGKGYPGAGIYLDLQSDTITVAHNTLYHNETGLFMDNSSSNTIVGNVMYDNLTAQLEFNEFQVQGSIHDNEVQGNVFFPTNTNAPVTLKGSFDNLAFGTFSNNNYSQLYTAQSVDTSYLPNYNSADYTVLVKSYTLGQWQTIAGQDLGTSNISQFSINPWTSTPTASNLVANSVFTADSNNWSSYSDNNDESLSWISACANGPGGCMSAITNSINAIFFSTNLSVTSGQTYLIQFDARLMSGDLTSVGTYVERSVAPYEFFTSASAQSPVDTIWKTKKTLVQAFGTAANAAFYFQVPLGQSVQMDNVSLTPVNVTYNDSSLDSRILSNPTSQDLQFACPDGAGNSRCSQYINYDGSPVNFPVTLAPYNASVIAWTASPNRI